MQNSRPLDAMCTQVDIGAATHVPRGAAPANGESTQLLRDLLAAQDRQNELLEEVVGLLTAKQRQQQAELNKWREAHPRLARDCKTAAEVLGRAQNEYLVTLVGEVTENAQELLEGEFVLNEFLDRFGQRLGQLNGVLQVLAHLGLPGDAPTPEQE